MREKLWVRLLLWVRGSRGVFEEKTLANAVNYSNPLKMVMCNAHEPCLSANRGSCTNMFGGNSCPLSITIL